MSLDYVRRRPETNKVLNNFRVSLISTSCKKQKQNKKNITCLSTAAKPFGQSFEIENRDWNYPGSDRKDFTLKMADYIRSLSLSFRLSHCIFHYLFSLYLFVQIYSKQLLLLLYVYVYNVGGYYPEGVHMIHVTENWIRNIFLI